MDSVIHLLNSTGFQTAVALLVGAFIFVQRLINQRDELKNAAQLILIDIQSAERKIKNVKGRLIEGVLESDVSIINSDSWALYRHKLASFLDRDEWDDLDSFYDKASLLDSTIKYNSQMFRNDVEQIRINKQRAAADFAIDTVNNIGGDSGKEDIAEVFSSKVKVYDTLYMGQQGAMSYTPSRVVDDANKYINSMPDIMNSPALSKLKSLASTAKV